MPGTADAVVSALADLRGVPLARLPGVADLDAALRRVLPGDLDAPAVPVAAFNSAI